MTHLDSPKKPKLHSYVDVPTAGIQPWQIENSNTLTLTDNLVEVKDGAITYLKLKIATGSVIQDVDDGAYWTFSTNRYSFPVNLGQDGGDTTDYFVVPYPIASDSIPRYKVYNASGGVLIHRGYWDYITASEKPVVAVIPDKENYGVWCSEPIRIDGKIINPMSITDKD